MTVKKSKCSSLARFTGRASQGKDSSPTKKEPQISSVDELASLIHFAWTKLEHSYHNIRTLLS